MRFAQVLVDVPTEELSRTFEYEVAESLKGRVRIGSRVRVPFGATQRVGYVMDLYQHKTRTSVRPLTALIDEDPPLHQKTISLCQWLARYYLAPLNEALALALPPGTKMSLRKEARLSSRGEEALQGRSLDPDERIFLEYLKRCGGRADLTNPKNEEIAAIATSKATIMMRKGLLNIGYRTPAKRRGSTDKSMVVLEECESVEAPTPTAEQGAILLALSQMMGEGGDTRETARGGCCLIQGVTGSGKTEIYLRVIEAALEAGRTALVTVPEIALTPQMVERFKERFQQDVAVLHSGLTTAERKSQWQGVQEGRYRVVVGARSALFAPLRDIGVIVVDEEHEVTYKQNRHPRYHARDVAVKRAELEGALCLLGTATPSLETRYDADQGRYRLERLTKRVADRHLPQITVVDMRQEDQQTSTAISSSLRRQMRETLERDEKVIIFLNRRGFASFLLCRSCGWVFRCPHCAVSLVYHQPGDLRCHHCQHAERAPEICPGCKKPDIKMLGVGTQRVETEIRDHFPDSQIFRMDADTTKGRNSHYEILKAFKDSRRGILLGTQMIAKGLDFPEVTLVGVINADTPLYLPDFRAAERTFQLLMQVGGRAGRGEQPGSVIVQTYSPEHYAIQAAVKGDYDLFYEQELEFRRELSYPPFTSLINLLFTGSKEHQVEEVAKAAAAIIEASKPEGLKGTLGPSPAPFPRLRGQYRWHLVMKVGDAEAAKAFLESNCEDIWPRTRRKEVTLTIDVDPVWML